MEAEDPDASIDTSGPWSIIFLYDLSDRCIFDLSIHDDRQVCLTGVDDDNAVVSCWDEEPDACRCRC